MLMVLLGILSQWVFTESKLFLKTTKQYTKRQIFVTKKKKKKGGVGGGVTFTICKYDELMTSSEQNVSKMN